MGRLAEAEGESAISEDLRMKLFIDPEDLKARYAASPEWLRRLMVALGGRAELLPAQPPQVHPRVIQRFEPWMALSFTEGSIGGDIEDVPLDALQAFYGAPGDTPRALALDAGPVEPRRLERHRDRALEDREPPRAAAHQPAHVVLLPVRAPGDSDEGLNVYGAATWGQFFVYQGFNERVGWMHTSSGVDNVDFFEETIDERTALLLPLRNGAAPGRHFGRSRALPRRGRAPAPSAPSPSTATHHGPVVRQKDGRWVSVALMQKPVEALSQSYLLTKARTYAGS